MAMTKKSDIDEYLDALKEILDNAQNDKELFEAIVNAPFLNKRYTTQLGLGIVVLLLVNKATQTIDRIALSKTEQAEGAQKYSVKPFREIKIPVRYQQNIIARTIETNESHITDDWQYMFVPELTSEEARFNQAGAGIGCSVVYPLPGARDGGAMIFSYYEPPESIRSEHRAFMAAYASLVASSLAK